LRHQHFNLAQKRYHAALYLFFGGMTKAYFS